jgi:hypothetical protein
LRFAALNRFPMMRGRLGLALCKLCGKRFDNYKWRSGSKWATGIQTCWRPGTNGAIASTSSTNRQPPHSTTPSTKRTSPSSTNWRGPTRPPHLTSS